MTDDEKIIKLYNKVPKQTPRIEIDQKIRAAAEKNIQPRSRTRQTIWALSSVAVLVLCVSVVIQLAPQNPLAPQSSNPVSDDDILLADGAAPFSQSDISAENFEEAAIEPSKIKSNNLKQKKLTARMQTESKARMSPEIAQPSQIMMSPMNIEIVEEDSDLVHFEFNLKQLTSINHALTGTHVENDIHIYHRDKLVLHLYKQSQHSIKVTAFPSSHILGVDIDWEHPLNQELNCRLINSSKHCLLNPTITGVYQSNRLMSVYWIQNAVK